jgi:hypothetical protein
MLCAVTACAVTKTEHLDLEAMTYMDSAAPDDNYYGLRTARVLLNGVDSSECRVLLRAPEILFDLDVARLAKVELNLYFFNRNGNTNVAGGRELFFHPLTESYDATAATWNQASAGTPWTSGGGFFMTNRSVSTFTYGPGDYSKVTWDLRPLLANTNARAALKENGALIRMADSPFPSPSDDPNMPRTPFVTPFDASNVAEQPDLYAVVVDPFVDSHLFALSYIDSRSGDEDTVFWEQSLSTVARVVLNGTDGSECRAILSMPEDLVAADPARIQSVVAKFDAQMQEWSGERIFLYPITTETRLIRRPNDEADPPLHGPTWNHADAPVEMGETGDWIAWTVPGGDWAAEYKVEGALTPPVSGTTGTAVFDLTALWKNPVARELLEANGAIVVMDPAAWPEVLSRRSQPRVNLYCPDEYVQISRGVDSHMRITEYAPLDGGTILSAYIDSSAPDDNLSTGATMRTLLNSDGSECRTLLHFPEGFLDVNAKQVGDVNLFLTLTGRTPGSNYRMALHPVSTSFTPSEVTWNAASSETPWTTAGGDFLPAYVQGRIDVAQGSVQFSLAGLLQDAHASAALANNGALLRMLNEFPEGSSIMVNTIGSNGVIPADRPVAMAVPAELRLQSLALTESGAIVLDVAGMNPLHSYEVWSRTNLDEGEDEWTFEAAIPADGTCVWPATASTAFYQVRRN